MLGHNQQKMAIYNEKFEKAKETLLTAQAKLKEN